MQQTQLQQPAAKLSKAMSTLLVYHRAFVAFLVLPTAALAFVLAITTTNILTRGHGLAALIVAIALHAVLESLGLHFTSNRHAQVIDISWVRLAIKSMVVGLAVARFVLLPVSDACGFSLAWLPDPWSFCRFFGALLVLQLAVLARCFGPQSIMRCSPFPLVSNPFDNFFLQLVNNPVVAILEPGETSGELFAKPRTKTSLSTRRGRRCRHPAFFLCLAQMAVAAASGVVVSFVFVSSMFDSIDAAAGLSFVGCIFATLLPVIPIVRGDAHEIDPALYTNGSFVNNHAGEGLIRVLSNSVLAVVLAFLTLCRPTDMPLELLFVSFKLFVCLVAVGLSQTLFDHVLWWFFFFDIGFEEDVDTTLFCLLQDASIVHKTLAKGDMSQIATPLEAQELRLVESLARGLGVCMMSKTASHAEAPLEEDVLRFTVLQSLGGGHDGASTLQTDRIRELASTSRASNKDPAILLVARGLCVFAGGVGEALQLCSEKRVYRNRSEHWTIPPGAIMEMALALQGILNCFRVVSEDATQATAAQLFRLAPAAVTSIFRMRHGIRSAFGLESLKNEKRSRGFARLKQLVQECDRVAALVVCSIPAPPEHIPSHVEKDVAEWLHLLQRTNSS